MDTFATVDPDGTCGFIASFEDTLPGQPLLSPTCIDFDATSCGSTVPTPPTVPITPMPVPPSPAPTPSCISNLNDIVAAELMVSDLTVRRTYVLCPNTSFPTGLVVNGQVEGGQFPIPLRPNMTVQCGDNGSRDNSCRIVGGFGLLSGPSTFADVADLGLAIVQGVTFTSLNQTTLFIGQFNGVVEIKDCVFEVRLMLLCA